MPPAAAPAPTFLPDSIRARFAAIEKYFVKSHGAPIAYKTAWDTFFLENDPSEEDILTNVHDESSIAMLTVYHQATGQAKTAAKKQLLKKAMKNMSRLSPTELFFHGNGVDKVKTWLMTKANSADQRVEIIADCLLEAFDIIHHNFSSSYVATRNPKKSMTAKIAAQNEQSKWALYHFAMRLRKMCGKQTNFKSVYVTAWKEIIQPIAGQAILQGLSKSVCKTTPKLTFGTGTGTAPELPTKKTPGIVISVKELQEKMLAKAIAATSQNGGRKGRPYDNVKHWTEIAQLAKRTGNLENWSKAKKTTCPNCLYRNSSIESHSLGECKEKKNSFWLICQNCHSKDESHWFDQCSKEGPKRRRTH